MPKLPNQPDPFSPSPLAREIFAYLQSHPQARDSLEGIVEWWMMERIILREMAEVKKALGELVRIGWIEERESGKEMQYSLPSQSS